MRYASNITDCRRCYVLGYFGEKFDRRQCRNGCDNCIENQGSIEEDMTEAAINIIQLVQSARKANFDMTETDCRDAFRGAETKTMRSKGYDRLSLYGAGKGIDRAVTERTVQHLLGNSILDTYDITNGAGWTNAYIKVCASHESFRICVFMLFMSRLGH
jgi:superfamily II DNA helicase RecQ